MTVLPHPSRTFADVGVCLWLPSRRICSLSSAVFVCWTKPNHAFFTCQQSCAMFFCACVRALPETCAQAAAHRLSALASLQRAIARSMAACKQQCGFQSIIAARAPLCLIAQGNACAAHVDITHSAQRAPTTARIRAGFRVAQVGLREHCAKKIRARARCDARMRRAKRKNPRRAGRGFRHSRALRRITRLRRAAPRSRRGRAVR